MLSLDVSLRLLKGRFTIVLLVRRAGQGLSAKKRADFVATLMRSSDPGREFADMGGKAMCVSWMVEHAPSAFAEARS